MCTKCFFLLGLLFENNAIYRYTETLLIPSNKSQLRNNAYVPTRSRGCYEERSSIATPQSIDYACVFQCSSRMIKFGSFQKYVKLNIVFKNQEVQNSFKKMNVGVIFLFVTFTRSCLGEFSFGLSFQFTFDIS